MYYRQLERLAKYGTDDPLGNDALQQLRECWIINPYTALATLRFHMPRLLRLQCGMCGHRHFKLPFSKHVRPNYSVFCHYGILYDLRHMLDYVIFAATQGED